MRFLFVFALLILNVSTTIAQNFDKGMLSGDIQFDFQYYRVDSSINFIPPPEKYGVNSWTNLVYRRNNLTLGVRYEAFQNSLIGYNKRLNGQGIPHKFLNYQKGDLSVTVGNYYVQFGNGLLIRSYEDRGLGIDNSLNGVKIEYSVLKNIYLTLITGKPRYYMTTDNSIMKGGNVVINVTDFLKNPGKVFWRVGTSYVSRYYEDFRPNYPPIVETYSVRSKVGVKIFNIEGEYAQKTADPSLFVNWMDSTRGTAYYVNTSYFKNGLGFSAQYKKVIQFDFRSNPEAFGIDRMVNFPTPIAKQHTLKLFSRYPFATQSQGEEGIQLEINYSPKRGKSFLINYSKVHDEYFNEKFYETIYVEADLKLSKKHHSLFAYQYIDYNRIIQLKKGMLYGHIFFADWSYRLARKKNLRGELQYLYTEQDKNDWIYGLAELTLAPHFGVAIIDEYNIGNTDQSMRKHFYTISITYVKEGSKFIFTYGKQNEGYQCAGGICRYVPANNGFGLSMISKF